MMKDFVKRICVGLLVCCATPMWAQYTNSLVLRDSITGKDTIINDVTFKEMTPYSRQRGVLVTVWLGEKESMRSYSPTQVSRYTQDGVTYKSKSLVYEGRRQQFLLPEVYQRDSIRIYQFLPEEEVKQYYISIGDTTSLLIPMQDSQRRKGTNAVRTYLESFPLAKERAVKEYIAKMKPTPASFDERYEVVKSGNANTVSYFRWGVQAGIGISSLKGGEAFDDDTSLFAGVFFDVPIAAGFSLHPEVNFQHYANSFEKDNKYYMAYNRDDISVPVLIRYTIRNVRGKWLPYFQVGPKLDFGIKRDLESLQLGDDNLQEINGKMWKKDAEDLDSFNIGLSAGVGVEWKAMRNHSIFFDARYMRDFMDDYTSGFYFSVAFNL